MYASTRTSRMVARARPLRGDRPRLEDGRAGETYNVGSAVEATIEEIADSVLELTGKPASLKTIVPDEPGTTPLPPRCVQDHDRARLDLVARLRRRVAETVAWYAATRLVDRSKRAHPSRKPPGNRRIRSRPSGSRREHKELIDRSYPGACARSSGNPRPSSQRRRARRRRSNRPRPTAKPSSSSGDEGTATASG